MTCMTMLALPVRSVLLLLPVLTDSWPVKDRSVGGLQQHDSRLQTHSTGGQNDKRTRNKVEVFQWWGEWSSWSSCSRSCGGGVRSQERHCLIQRRPINQDGNSSDCVGSPRQYQLCPNQPCPSHSMSFKQHQCSQFNSKAFGQRYFTWIPLYPADYISISNKPCDLQCTTISRERQLLIPAHDGTFCRDTKFHGICIEGVCQPVGCDGRLYSSRTVDRCGVCGGNGTSCQRVSGSYRTPLTQLGYVFITHIPPGASDIQIIERHKTENILALSDETGHFFFNGRSVFDDPQNFKVAGTVFKYRRPSRTFSEGLEYIMAQGPTQQGLNLMYYNLNGKLPYITYEFTVPSNDIPAAGRLVTGPAHSAKNLAFPRAGDDIRGEHLEVTNQSGGSVTSVYHYNTQLDPDDQSDVAMQEEGEGGGGEIRTPSPSTPDALVVYNSEDVTSQVISQNDVEELSPPAPSEYRSSSNMINEPSDAEDASLLLSVPGAAAPHEDTAPYLLPQELHHNQTHSNTHSVKHTFTAPHVEAPAGTELHRDTHKDTHRNAHTVTHTVLSQVQQVSAVQVRDTESNNFDVLDPDVGVADMYRWKVSAFAPCSSTCTTGITTSYALCVRFDGAEVDDSYCNAQNRPEPTHEFCSGKECAPRWETSGWSQCSRTCGEGLQYRTVRCWKMLSPGLDSSVYDSLCLSHDLHKPANRKVCLGQSCGPQWEVSEWSECSARCGFRGVRTREVRCSMEMKLCNKTSQPIESQECLGPPCDRRWTVTDWGPCSGVCGDGRMVRAVMCRSSDGVVMSEEQCDQSLRPLAVHPCGDKDCAPHWVEQEWQQCNTSCGRGLRRRQVVCAGLEGGLFREFPGSSCDLNNQPESSSSCFRRPCYTWFSTAWSQCSKTCGSGVQVREVKCYQGEELVLRGHSCDSALKPEGRQSCEIQSCPTEAPAALLQAASPATADSCQDKTTANCGLVLKVKLCSHWYYRKACCLSCSNPRP